MRARTQKVVTVFFVAGSAFFGAALPTVGKVVLSFKERTGTVARLSRGGATHAVKLNKIAFAYSKELIKEGQVIVDKRNAWSEHQPSTEEENEFIRLHGFEDYAKWHLGIDERHAENSKARYKFPYGDFENVHRSAVLAVQSRASQYKHYDIEKAAIELREMIEAKNGRLQKR
jgi:hypothetical protein